MIKNLLRSPNLDKIDARILLQYVTGWTYTQLIMREETCLNATQMQQWQSLYARRIAGEPIAYLIGQRSFYAADWIVSPAVLIPRPETEHLVEAALAHIPLHQACKVLDLGTGSGIIGLSIAFARPAAEVIALDVSAEALAIAAQNQARLQLHNVTLLTSNWYSALTPSADFDVIVSNPPYIAADDVHLQQGDLRFEPVNALTDFADGLTCLRTIIHHAPCYLKIGGWLCVEHGYDQAHACQALFQAAGFSQIETQADFAGQARLTLGQFVST